MPQPMKRESTEMPGEVPSPEIIFDTFNAYQKTASLKAALELDIFTAMGEGNRTAKALATRCKASERGVRILCDYLVVNGFLSKERGEYGLSPVSATFLDRHSPMCLASIAEFLTSPYLTDGFKDIAALVRRGGAAVNEQGSLAPDHPMWGVFARSMAPMMAPTAEVIAQLVHADSGEKWKVLDIAAGHGLFGIAIARHNPNSEIIALDWPQVLTVAQENARAAWVGPRYRLLPGSAFDVDFGA